MNWLEISLEVTGELAEPVSDLFARYSEGGVALIQADEPQEAEQNAPLITVRAYIPLDDQSKARKQAIEEGLWHLSQISPLPLPAFQEITQKDWSQVWRKRYQPIPVGKSLLVLPAWMEPPADQRHLIIVEPGMAFGTGTHPSTRMSLMAIEEYCQRGETVIDLGCGSGILSIAAVRCGARQVTALDIDPEAIVCARDNLRLNGMDQEVALVQGSVEEAQRQGKDGGASLLVANILAPILGDLLEQGLAKLVAEDGIVILSGILEAQLEDLLLLTREQGLDLINTYAEDDWRTIVLKYPAT